MYSEVQLGEYDLGLIPFEDDVLSMEIAESYREVKLLRVYFICGNMAVPVPSVFGP